MSDKGFLFVISGPSGVGKGAICKKLIAGNNALAYSVSLTTREPRFGEIAGVDYFFVSRHEFEEKIAADEFLEWAEVFGNFYGTPKKNVYDLLAAGKDVILEIDVQGAMKVKASCPEGVFVFILPPEAEELRRRIEKRGTETAESIAQRFNKAKHEMSMLVHYDFKVINDDIDAAAREIESIISSLRASCGDKARAETKPHLRVNS
jgi:guanylate kinase